MKYGVSFYFYASAWFEIEANTEEEALEEARQEYFDSEEELDLQDNGYDIEEL